MELPTDHNDSELDRLFAKIGKGELQFPRVDQELYNALVGGLWVLSGVFDPETSASTISRPLTREAIEESLRRLQRRDSPVWLYDPKEKDDLPMVRHYFSETEADILHSHFPAIDIDTRVYDLRLAPGQDLTRWRYTKMHLPRMREAAFTVVEVELVSWRFATNGDRAMIGYVRDENVLIIQWIARS